LFIDGVGNSLTFSLLTSTANLLKLHRALLIIDSVALLLIANAADLLIDSAALLLSIVRALLLIDSVCYCGALSLIPCLALRCVGDGAPGVLHSGALLPAAHTADLVSHSVALLLIHCCALALIYSCACRGRGCSIT